MTEGWAEVEQSPSAHFFIEGFICADSKLLKSLCNQAESNAELKSLSDLNKPGCIHCLRKLQDKEWGTLKFHAGKRLPHD